jgi:hypothetical protein
MLKLNGGLEKVEKLIGCLGFDTRLKLKFNQVENLKDFLKSKKAKEKGVEYAIKYFEKILEGRSTTSLSRLEMSRYNGSICGDRDDILKIETSTNKEKNGIDKDVEEEEDEEELKTSRSENK